MAHKRACHELAGLHISLALPPPNRNTACYELAGCRFEGRVTQQVTSTVKPSPEGGVPAPGGDEVHEQRDDEHAQAANHDSRHPDPGRPPPVRHLRRQQQRRGAACSAVHLIRACVSFAARSRFGHKSRCRGSVLLLQSTTRGLLQCPSHLVSGLHDCAYQHGCARGKRVHGIGQRRRCIG